jgi:putative ABC transport system permease protein
MASFTAEQRTREIGIRKILGASSKNIIVLISKEFTYLILAANIIIWPIAYYTTDYWLQSFAYRIDLSLWIFIASGLLTLIIALSTVTFQTWKAARSNPADTLRYE